MSSIELSGHVKMFPLSRCAKQIVSTKMRRHASRLMDLERERDDAVVVIHLEKEIR